MRQKGKIRRTDFFQGLEKLKINLSQEDTEKLWAYMDIKGNGKINFSQFCILGDHKTLRIIDPFQARALESHVHEGLVKERAEERDKMAKDIIQKL